MLPPLWPYTTPSGHVYVEPATYEALQERVNDAGQAVVESWYPAEHPPGPTWAMVGIAQMEVLRLRAELREVTTALEGEVTRVEVYHELLDRFAYAVAPESEIGEHSSGNDPWARALQIIEGGSE